MGTDHQTGLSCSTPGDVYFLLLFALFFYKNIFINQGLLMLFLWPTWSFDCPGSQTCCASYLNCPVYDNSWCQKNMSVCTRLQAKLGTTLRIRRPNPFLWALILWLFGQCKTWGVVILLGTHLNPYSLSVVKMLKRIQLSSLQHFEWNNGYSYRPLILQTEFNERH